MEVPELTCLASPARDQPTPAPGPSGTPGGQALPSLTLGPVILPREQGLAPAVFLKALPIPLYHTVPPGGLQPRAPLVTGSVDGGGVPFILSPVLQPEGPGPSRVGKPAAPLLTVNIVGALPVLSPSLAVPLGSPGKVRSAGKHLCPHCGRDCLKPSVLEKHIRSHTGERPFPCASCGIAFKTQSNLYKHRRTQTHLNNSRLPSESDGAGGSLLDEGDKAGETSRGAGKGDSWSQGGSDGARSGRQGTGHCPEPPAHVCPVAKNLDLRLDTVPCPGSAFADREAPLDSTWTASPGLPQAGPQPRRKLPEQKSPTAGRSCSLQQQQATSSEKPWDAKALETRLRKCESTDSGYLSRSDSVEQPLAPCSPLHSLSEHSAESEGEGVLGPGGARAEPGGRGASLELEKRQLEERIARLISHNQAVVDDPQLDNVRPRKTILCKQGSIDLPMPYTYKDSFHFEIRALEPGRRRPGALCSTRSTCTPLDKARPLFFHSVPTQLSTTVECIPVTRSNSLPFIEGTRMWQEPPGPQDTCPRRQKALSPRPIPAQLVDVPSCHPRALVRQAAVEDQLCPATGDALALAEDLEGKGAAGGGGAAGKGRAASRKCSQRKLRMLPQEKWQVYGNETFKRIYQKMKTSHRGGKKARGARGGSGTELDCPLREEAEGSQGRAPLQDGRTLVCGNTSVGAKPGPWRSPPAMGTLVTEPPNQRETVARAGGCDQPRVSRAVSPPTINCREPLFLGSESPLLPPNGRLELGCQLSPVPGPLKGKDLEAPRPVVPDPKLDRGGACGGGGTKDTSQQIQPVLRRPSGRSGEPQPKEDKLPSERKKLRVEELSCQEQLGPLGEGGEPPGVPEQAASPLSRNQDSDPGDKPGGLHRSADGMARARDRPAEGSGALSTASSMSLRPAGPRDEELTLCPAAVVPGCHSQLATQPRAPGTLAALAAAADTAFPPKYLLKLPQGEAHLLPPGAQGPGHGRDPLCRSGQPEKLASFVGSGLGTVLPPGPASGLAPGGADSFGEDPSWSKLWDRRKGVQGDEKGDLDTGTPAAGVSLGSATGALRETASSLHTLTYDSRRSETHDSGSLCMGGAGARARPSGGVPSPWTPSGEMRKAPEDAPRDPPSGPPPPALSLCCCLRPSSSPSALTPPGWPELALCTHSETPGSCGAQGPFPSLRAKPQLTWCCLNRSLPLPMEQKEATSVYLALHFPGGSSPEEGPDTRPVSRAMSGGWTRTSAGQGEQTHMSKLSCPTASGMTSQDRGSEPEWKKGPPRRKGKASHRSSKQRKLSISSRRYRGTFLQSRVQLKAGRLRKPLRVLRKDGHPPSLKGLDPHRTLGQSSSEMAGRNLHGEPPCATSESPPGCGNKEKEEEESRPTSRGNSPSTSSRAVRETDTLTVKGLSPSADECGDCCPQNAAVGSVSSLPSGSRMTEAGDSLQSRGDGFDVGLLETEQPPSQEQVSADPRSCIFSDAQEPFSKGNSAQPDVATSAAASCTSLEARAGHTVLEMHGAEPQDHNRIAGETLTQSSPDRKAIAEGISPSLLPRKPSPGRGISGPVLLRSPGKAHLEIPVSGPGSTSSHPEEGRHKTLFPCGGQSGCGDALVPCPPVGNDSEKCHVSGLIALKDCVVPSNPGEPAKIPEAPSKTIKKRSLEGMRKQTRVELSDTSSDDEDRLVIEI